MNSDEKLLAQKMFRLKMYQQKGMAFQAFFVDVMTRFDPDFTPVKPHGQEGDKKNDGFIPSKGKYYQVYAPEAPDNKKSISTAIKKCKKDFAGLLDFWDSKTPIKEFYFVFNEEYRGAYPEILAVLSEIQKNNPKIKASIFICKDLENIFWEISDDDRAWLINCIPSPQKIEMVDYDALTEAINYIIENKIPIDGNNNLVVPDFDKKIKFNNLSPVVAALLTTANQQASALEDYFEANSNFSREYLQKKFINFYVEALKRIREDLPDKSDLVFLNILEKSSPRKERHVQDAVLVLMAYFFETCDIFKEPK